MLKIGTTIVTPTHDPWPLIRGSKELTSDR
jgi:hypothetical protein